jgi:hypothetical protein
LPLPEGFKEAAVWLLLLGAMLWRPTCSCAPWSAPARSSMPLPWRAFESLEARRDIFGSPEFRFTPATTAARASGVSPASATGAG